jgi:hypothetical protein
MVEPGHPQLSIARQCRLVSISRSGFYHRPAGGTPLNLGPMRLIDTQFLEAPWYGSRERGARIGQVDAAAPTPPGFMQCGHSSGVRTPACG